MNDQTDPISEGVLSGPPALPPALVSADSSLAVALARAEVDQQIATARAFPRSIGNSLSMMTEMATMNIEIAEECIYSLPRGGKQIRGPSIRFAEIVRNAWGNSRDDARVEHVDRIARTVECKAIYHDLQANIATSATVNRTIELKKGKHTVDQDMIQLAGAAGMSIARRNAILGGVPRIVWQQALDRVEQVIRGDQKTLGERRDRAIAYFAKVSVSIERLLKQLGKPTVEDVDLDDLVTMNGWRVAITEGQATIDELFPEERKPGPKMSLDERMEALVQGAPPNGASASPSDPPPEGEGEAAKLPIGPSPTDTAGEPSKTPAGQGADGSPSSAPDAPEKPASGNPTPKAADPAPKGKTAASGADKAAEARRAKQSALAARGAEVAAKGHDALMEWIDNLPGDDQALISPLMEQNWRKAAEGK
jgi:hypothetical protein